ncbi:MAG: prophage tail fiber N-terminal domain-containing protein [Gilliamella sp.]|uniref:prophage tail fiber N-terminal domain-containing protein n=1 Tax=Gilliamella sp. TaxID=1891236 RepID=UPI002603A397|nr:prophage tail fiber N-terminal domain-containing protein [Gilliamella sp.]MCO6551485.1 prophage tail fiber N-terminal domain-containing protein [Gilliamella sp.]
MAKISGVLTDGAGNIINNCTIELCAKKTTNKVLTQTQVFQVADNGSYTMNVLPCDYDVKLIINGFPPKKLGTIQVFSDSKDGTLNDFLLNPLESEITPEILQQVIDARNHANKSAEKAANSERNSKTSETNAKTSADNAKASETNAKNIANSVENLVANASNSAQSASESATIAKNASTSAKSYSDSAKSYVDSASSSATASRNSAQQSSNSANAASSSERNAKTFEQNAKKSADEAKNAALSIDTTSFIKKTGEENQSINGSLDVKKLNEQGQRVYSPNNKPTADDIGAVPAIKEVVNNSPIYKVGAHVDVAKLTVGGKSVITDVSNIQNQINQLDNRIYIVESYANGNGWYNVYSNGFIEQSGVISINTNDVRLVISTVINLLKPMRTQNYGVSIDFYSDGGPWGWVRFACGEMYNHNFWLKSYTEANPGITLIRWTVRGY